MSILRDVQVDINKANINSDITFDKIMLFESAAYNDYNIKTKEAALDTYKINGTTEYYESLVSEAASEYIEKAKAAINKIIEAVKEFLEDCRDKIMELVHKVQSSELIEKIENAIKRDPKIANTKVKYEDSSEKKKILRESLAEAKKKHAKLKAGKFSGNDSDEIEERDNKMALKIAAIAGTTVITLGAALLLYKKYIKNKITDDDTSDMKITDLSIFTPEQANIIIKNTNSIADKQKKIAKTEIEDISDILNGIKVAFSNIGTTIENNIKKAAGNKNLKPMKSYDKDSNEILNSYESTNVEGLDLDEYYNELCNDIIYNDSNVYVEGTNIDIGSVYHKCMIDATKKIGKAKKLIRRKNYKEAKIIINDTINDIKKAQKEISIIDKAANEDNSDLHALCGLLYRTVTLTIKAVLTLGIASVSAYKDALLLIKKLNDKTNESDEIDISAWNTYVNHVNHVLDMTIKTLNTLNTRIKKHESENKEKTVEESTSSDDVKMLLASDLLAGMEDLIY